MHPTLVWFRLDLRLRDNPALQAAINRGGPVIPVYIDAPEEEKPWEPGSASRTWLLASLEALDRELRAIGSRLIIRRGPTIEALKQLIQETDASAVTWNRRYEPAVVARDRAVESALKAARIEVMHFNAALLHEPETIRNQGNKPFQVFTPFWRHCLTRPEPTDPLPRPRRLLSPERWPTSIDLHALNKSIQPVQCVGQSSGWQVGERAAEKRLGEFIDEALDSYSEARDCPAQSGTSRLSPHLHFGEISTRSIWHEIRAHAARRGLSARTWREGTFLKELGWREFAHHVLWHFPHAPTEPLRGEFRNFRWRKEPDWLRVWQQGQTGYPIVDAGMRELKATGWMHNRVRMIAGSFLVKDLLISWQEGARWFWETLVDADLAQNTLGWQWVAGCGADAAPFFRVFNPLNQGEKFDPNGDYVRRWCPELARLPSRWIHRPHLAPAAVLESAGVVPGTTYPVPIVSHAIAREVALEAYARLRR